MARNLELERALIDDPDDVATYLVYADWLQQEGDPRGELIARMIHAESASPSDAKHNAMMGALMKRVGEPLIGELADCNPSWRRGFFHGVGLDGDRVKAPFPERLATLFRDPSAVLLHEISLRDAFGKQDSRASLAALAGAPQTLRELTLELDDDVGDLAPLHRFDRLAQLRIGFVLAHSPDYLPKHAAVSRAALRSIANAPWPLESLWLRFDDGDAIADDLVAVLQRDFRLAQLEIDSRSGAELAQKLVRALVESSFAPQLKRLWLDVPLARADYQLLVEHRGRFKALREIYVPSRTFKARLAPAQ